MGLSSLLASRARATPAVACTCRGEPMALLWPSASGWIVLGDVACDRLRSWPCIAFQGPNGSVPRARQQSRLQQRGSMRSASIDGGSTRWWPPEYLGGTAIGQSGATSDWAPVNAR
jgi:hypothetical protein